MDRKSTLFILAVFSLFVSACGGSTATPTTSPADTATATQPATPTSRTIDISGFNLQNYPRVDGSTSAYPLQIMLACQILNVPCIWLEGDLFGITRSIIPDPEFEGSSDRVEKIYNIWHSGTHGSYMNLIEGNSDIIIVARPPSEDELQAAEQADLHLEFKPIALDAFVFVLNEENPLEDIALDDIRNVYTGEITHWWQLGGSLDEIHTYQRNRNSGSQELMESLVMRGAPMIESPEMILESMMGPINALSDDPLGIGYSVYFYAAFIYPHERVKMIAVDSVHPTFENIADRSYPLTTEVYAVIRGDAPQESAARLLLAWLQTVEGQAAVAESGYVPILQ
ncbi:MAG: substrate-binding domain-containing protein [Anaerolineales bacterium]|nr:substrate-binding domain-containing protein [Anaerolineales bacterium]